MLRQELTQTGRISFREFYWRRFKRLVPALATTTIITCLIATLLSSPSGGQQSIFLTASGASLLVANLAIIKTSGGYFDGPSQLNALLNTWSLSVEEQFYLILPFLIWFFYRSKQGNSKSMKFLMALGALFSLSIVFYSNGSSQNASNLHEVLFGYYSIFTRAWEFSIGCAATLIMNKSVIQKLRANLKRTLVWLSLATLICFSISGIMSSTWPNLSTPIVCASTGVILVLNSQLKNKLLEAKTLTFVGDRSYSLYLWHFPMITFSRMMFPNNSWALLIGALFSVAPAFLSFKYIENPLRFREYVSLGSKFQLVLKASALPLIVSLSLSQVVSSGWGFQNVKIFESGTTKPHLVSQRSCDTRIALPGLENCSWLLDPSKPHVYLLGDSNAGQFSEGIRIATQESGWNITIATTDACPFVNLNFRDRRGLYDNNSCSKYVQKSFDYLRSSAPGIVIIANSNEYWQDSNYEVFEKTGFTTDSKAKTKVFKSALASTVAALTSSGHRVVLIQSVPKWTGRERWDPSRCTFIDVLQGNCSKRMSLTAWNQQDQIFRAIIHDTSSIKGSESWDLGSTICKSGICSTGDSSVQTYRDSGHISVQTSSSMSAKFKKLLLAYGSKAHL